MKIKPILGLDFFFCTVVGTGLKMVELKKEMVESKG